MRLATLCTALCASATLAFAWAPASMAQHVAQPQAFPISTVHFEQNATDHDYEVVFVVKAGKDGLAELVVIAPNGAQVITFAAGDRSTLGIRQFRFESPEPGDIAFLKAAYPEGEYLFRGKTFSGARFTGKSTLSHRLPGVARILSPTSIGDGKASSHSIAWQHVDGVESYLVEVKTEGSSIAARLPKSSTSLQLPEGFINAGRSYKLSIGTISRERNASFVESTFNAPP